MSSKPLAGAALALSLLAGTPLPAKPGDLQAAPTSKAYTAWVARHAHRGAPGPLGGTEEGGQRVRGYIPHPVDLSHLHGPVFTRGEGDPPFPPRFDLRAEGLTTPVKDQGQYGTCWAFACTGSLEATTLARANQALSLSEWHLAYYTYTPFNASLLTSFTPGWVSQGEDPVFDQGGNDLMAIALLARGTGAAAEKDCPYQTGSYRHEPRPQGDLPSGREEARVALEEALCLFGDSSTSAEDLKHAISHYGPTAVALDWEDAHFDLAQATYRDPGATLDNLNHEVCLVGWDDTFEPCRFPPSNRPSSPGAWIARNCWGRSWGLGGYFYISFDSLLFNGTVFLGGGRTCTRVHQYDPLGWCGGRGFGGPTAYCANVFIAPEQEKITAVSFYAAAVNTSYRLDLRTGLIGGGPEDLTTGKSLLADEQTGTFQAAGYHVVKLASPVSVPKGRFAVVLKLTTPGWDYPIPVQEPEPAYSDRTTYEHGRSFVSADGQAWKDLAPGCIGSAVCLKAFAEKD